MSQGKHCECEGRVVLRLIDYYWYQLMDMRKLLEPQPAKCKSVTLWSISRQRPNFHNVSTRLVFCLSCEGFGLEVLPLPGLNLKTAPPPLPRWSMGLSVPIHCFSSFSLGKVFEGFNVYWRLTSCLSPCWDLSGSTEDNLRLSVRVTSAARERQLVLMWTQWIAIPCCLWVKRV